MIIKGGVNEDRSMRSVIQSHSVVLVLRFLKPLRRMAITTKLGSLSLLHSSHDHPKNELSLLNFNLSQLGCPRFNQSSFLPKQRSTNAAPLVPTIRAQRIPEYVPDAKFYKVEAILRPWRVSQVSSALLKIGIRGVTVSDVRGFGAQGGSAERHGGSEFSEDKFVAKVKMEIVVSKDQVEAVLETIIQEARTGEIGDGKIFLVPISDVIRVRTGERGEKAEKMTGGRSDLFIN